MQKYGDSHRLLATVYVLFQIILYLVLQNAIINYPELEMLVGVKTIINTLILLATIEYLIYHYVSQGDLFF